MEHGQVLASLNRTIVVGPDLRRRLDVIARAQGMDVGYLGRQIVRRYVERHEAGREETGEPGHTE